MKGTKREINELETELLKLNVLVRQRRAQLARLQNCPNKDCECRRVWRLIVEKNLARQVGKLRKQVRQKTTHASSNRATRLTRARARARKQRS
jgi:hypothetical protein